MKELIVQNCVCFDVEAQNKQEVIRFLCKKIGEQGRLSDCEGYYNDVIEREKSFSTAVGYSVATPHAKSEHVKDATVAFARLKNEICWGEGEDTDKVKIVFQLAIPMKDQGDRHLQILAALARKLVHDEFRNQLVQSKSPEEVYNLISDIQ